jgi:lipid-A-disaccharide synthase
VKTRHFSQPNLLAGRELVPEFFQEQVRAELLGPAMLAQLERPDRADLEAAFREMHVRLRRNASERAAEAIVDLVRRKERT